VLSDSVVAAASASPQCPNIRIWLISLWLLLRLVAVNKKVYEAGQEARILPTPTPEARILEHQNLGRFA
jgi:hypothetical protein